MKKATGRNSTCKVGSVKQTLSNLYFLIAEDVYNGTPTHAQLTTLFGGTKPPTSGTRILQNSQVWGSSGTATGGVLVDLTTSGSILGCRNYLVVALHYNSLGTTYWSYTWHKLDFSTNTISCH